MHSRTERCAQCLICPEARLIHYGGQSDRLKSEKMIRLFKAKAQLFRKHWNGMAASFGITMLAVWALTRMIANGVLAILLRARRPQFRAWREIWRRRAEFLDLPTVGERSKRVARWLE